MKPAGENKSMDATRLTGEASLGLAGSGRVATALVGEPAVVTTETKTEEKKDIPAVERDGHDVEGRTLLSGGPCMDTVDEALDLTDWKFRVNVLTNERQINTGVDWRDLNDDALTSIRYELNRRFYYEKCVDKKKKEFADVPYQLTNDRSALWPVVMSRCDMTPVNPLTRWLDTCRESAVGHSESLLDTWLGRMFHFAPDYPDDVREWVSRRLICAIVARMVKPGTAWPRMVIFHGDQGIGKSCLSRHLLPPGEEWEPYYTNEFHFGMSPGRLVHAVRGKVIVECDEMKGSRKEVEDMRSFVTRTVDGSGERLAYRRNPEPVKRSCVLLGTANNPDCIPMDPYGNRRYMTVPLVGRHDPKSAGGTTANGRLVVSTMSEIRDVLFGLAYRVLEDDQKRTGEWGSMLLDDCELTPKFNALAESHRAVDEWEGPIEEFIEKWETNLAELGGYFKTQELAEYCRIVKLESGSARYESYATVSRRYHGRIRDILSGNGFGLVYTVRRFANGEKVRGWWHKESDMYRVHSDYRVKPDMDRRILLDIPAASVVKESGSTSGNKWGD